MGLFNTRIARLAAIARDEGSPPQKLDEEHQIQGKPHCKKRQYNVEPVVLYAPRPDDAPQRNLGRVEVDAAVSDANVIAGRVSRERPDDAQTQQRNGAMGHEETSIVRLTDAAIVDGAIIAAVGRLSEYHCESDGQNNAN